MRLTAAIALALALSLLAACGGGISFGGPVGGSTPYTDYFLLGEDIYNLRGPDASDPDVYGAVQDLMQDRALFMGLYSRGGTFDSQWTDIRSGNVTSRLMDWDGFDFHYLSLFRGSGYQDAFGSYVDVYLELRENESLLPGFEDLQLDGIYDFYDAQYLIDDVSYFPFRDAVSAFTTPATWRLSGYHYGSFFEVTFEQDLRAVAEYYNYYDYYDY